MRILHLLTINSLPPIINIDWYFLTCIQWGNRMRRINVSELVPGMIVAEDVYNYNNQLILPKGLILNDKTITKLAYYSIFTIKIDEEPAEQVTDISPYEISYSEKIQKSSEFIRFRAEFEKDVDAFKQVINDVVEKGAPLDVDKLMNHTLNILDISATTPCVFDMLHNMREYDDATYVHCINVALICNIFARWLRMSEEQIQLATASGLLHDIGKPESARKNGKKNPEDAWGKTKDHDVVGEPLAYEFCKNIGMTNEDCDTIAWLVKHHMRAHQLTDIKSKCKIWRMTSHPLFSRLVKLAEADENGCRKTAEDEWQGIRTAISRSDIAELIGVPMPARLLTGDDLISKGYTPGPLFKKALDRAYQGQIDEHITAKEVLYKKFAKGILKGNRNYPHTHLK